MRTSKLALAPLALPLALQPAPLSLWCLLLPRPWGCGQPRGSSCISCTAAVTRDLPAHGGGDLGLVLQWDGQ